jgi:AraC family transcriptional regulator
MSNSSIPVALAGLVPAVCDAEAGPQYAEPSSAAEYAVPQEDSNDSSQSSKRAAEDVVPLAEHRFSFRDVKTAIVELCSAVRSALDDERGAAEESLRRAAETLQKIGEKQPLPAREQPRGGLAPWQIRKVASYVDANLDRSIRNEHLAAIARLNASHFGRAFRSSFGEPPHEYVIRRRVERAQGLMLSTSAPLSAIALDCGLSDQAHLSRLFRRVVGESPRAWRRARLGEPVGSN